MYSCLQSIADSQATAHAKNFAVYARLVKRAADNAGELPEPDIGELADVLVALPQTVDAANQDVADLIELAQLEPIAAGLADAQRAYDENVTADRAVFVAARVKLASIDAEIFAKRDWISVGEIAEFERAKDATTTDERKEREQIQNSGRVLAARLTFLQDAGRRVQELKGKMATILAVELGDTTGENGDAPKAEA